MNRSKNWKLTLEEYLHGARAIMVPIEFGALPEHHERPGLADAWLGDRTKLCVHLSAIGALIRSATCKQTQERVQ